MKHRIVGDHHQLLAFEFKAGEEMFVFNARVVFTRGNIEVTDTGLGLKPDAESVGKDGLPPDAKVVKCPDAQGMIGLIPGSGGHIKRVEIGPPSGMVVAVDTIFALSRGVNVSQFKAGPEIAAMVENVALVRLQGIGVVFLKTDENFIEFRLGVGEEINASMGYVAAFSGGMKMNPAAVSRGKGMVLFSGPGNLILASG